jgi:hypothetical protein
MPKNMIMIKTAKSLVLCSPLAFAAFACNRGADSNRDSAQVSQGPQTSNSGTPITLRGTVVSVTTNQLVLQADTGKVTVAVTQPFRFYTRVPSVLSKVKESSFIGVTTVRQPDGTERATEIHIFPEELRGLGEGSRMMGPPAVAGARPGASRMTNGNVSASRMTNGKASQSRMSNGSVSSTSGSSIVVQYAGGSQNVTVPPKTPVTELEIAPRNLAAGDHVALLIKKAADGSLTADQAISTAK